MIYVLIPLAIGCVVLLFAACLYAGMEGRWPHWHFVIFCAWWWPFRGESAATVTAAALDCDENADEWRYHESYGDWSVKSDALKTALKLDDMKGPKLTFDHDKIPLSAWDDHCLIMAADRWRGRFDARVREAAKYDAAETLVKTFKARRKSERTGA